MAHLHLEQCRDEAQCIRNSLLDQLREDPSKKWLLAAITELGALCQTSLPERDFLFLNIVRHVPSQLVQILNKYKLLDGRNHTLEESHSANTFSCKISNFQIRKSDDLIAVNFYKDSAEGTYIFEDGCLISLVENTRRPRDDIQEKVIDAITAVLKGTASINSLPKVV